MLTYSFNPSKSIWIKQHIFSQFWRKELTNRCLYQQVLTELSAMTSHDNITSFIVPWHFVFVLVLWRANVLIINDVVYCGFVEWHLQFIFILLHSKVQNLLNVLGSAHRLVFNVYDFKISMSSFVWFSLCCLAPLSLIFQLFPYLGCFGCNLYNYVGFLTLWQLILSSSSGLLYVVDINIINNTHSRQRKTQ